MAITPLLQSEGDPLAAALGNVDGGDDDANSGSGDKGGGGGGGVWKEYYDNAELR